MKRQGFTLIEMLVATALTLFLMVIVSQAFVTALDTFSSLKSIGDMEEGMRTAVTNLRFDLRQYHFEGTRKLSDPFIVGSPPQQGFFSIRQQADANTEGYDSAYATTVMPSLYAPGGPASAAWPAWPSAAYSAHSLHFTIRLQGNQPNSFLAAPVPNGSPLCPFQVVATGAPAQPNPGFQTTNSAPFDALYQVVPGSSCQYNSQWAEVAYFLVFQGTTVAQFSTASVPNQAAGVMPLFGLYRSMFVVPPYSGNINNAGIPSNQLIGSPGYQNVCCTANAGNTLTFFSPDDLATPVNMQPAGAGYTLSFNRAFDPFFNSNATYYSQLTGAGTLSNAAISGTANLRGSTLLLNNVVSFSVRPYQNVNGTPVLVPSLASALYDTTGTQVAPGGASNATVSFPISAIEISIRIWDPKTQFTRQITILQDM